MSQNNTRTSTHQSPDKNAKRLQNQVFRGDYNLSRYNACVGDNGAPNIYYYAEGFSEAVFLLIDSVKNDSRLSIDTLIYPICFNVRHSVELYLKALWGELSKLAEAKKVSLQLPLFENKPVNVLNTHEIGIIWDGVASNATHLDKRFSSVVEDLAPLIACIHEVDSTGQTFRYDYDMKTDTKHLVPVSLINIINLKRQFETIVNKLEELKKLSRYLNYEYSMGTFTKKLNRADIQNIAHRLPHRDRWKDGELSKVKGILMLEYGIGSREFSFAVKKIEELHDLSFNIGVEKEPLGLTKEDLLKFSDIWGVRNDINEWRDNLIAALDGSMMNGIGFEYDLSNVDDRINKMILDMEKNDMAFNEFIKYATPDNVSGCIALYEYRGCSFSEEYVNLYNNHFEYYDDAYKEGGERWDAAIRNAWSNYFEYSVLLKHMILSLRNLNMPSSAYAIEKHCMVEGLIR
ncbi:hypothetical protein [Aeromonas sp. 700377]|uniref:hypothetical protein n=1 Tax=Aeromonas sp. 700377 TaxID=2712056 RepID=UPI003B9EE04A